ncbi:hypothetical protein HYR54_14585 [Candidatus Acetothermia bacterium]|nr:hypothetical protein [Candidatus Acetothermia bacterium]
MGFNCPVGLAGIDCAFTATLIGESVGAVLGAAVGVGYIGMQRHIRGNLLLTVLGGALGVVFGTVLGIFAPSFPLLAFISVGAGFGTALGYNSGITMKAKTLSFSNQGLELAGIQNKLVNLRYQRPFSHR